jgi:PAS domain S-box-containing protein
MSDKESSDFFEKVLNAIPDMILVKREKSHLVWANKAFQEYYGMDNETLKSIIDAPFVEPDTTRQYVADDQWVWENKKLLKIECEPVTRHDGVIRKYQTYKTPILDFEGKIQFTVGVSRDLTEKIELEQRTEASSKMAALGEMAGGVAHEINNPLSIVVAKAQRALKLLQKNETQSLAQDLERIIFNAERIGKIVKGLKSFSRDGSKDPFAAVSLSAIIQETLSFCQNRIEKNGIELRIDSIRLAQTDCQVECRAVQISQVLLNLLNNAIDAVSGDTRERHLKWISISVSLDDSWAEIRVNDSGPGVPEDLELRVMQPFFTTKNVGRGTGLGLSVSLAIARDHGGFLKLDRSTSPSCFLLKIPIFQKK